MEGSVQLAKPTSHQPEAPSRLERRPAEEFFRELAARAESIETDLLARADLARSPGERALLIKKAGCALVFRSLLTPRGAGAK